MRSLYKIILLFVLLHFISTPIYSTIKVEENTNLIAAATPTGQISGNATVCLNAAAPLVKFEVLDDNGKEPYTFSYTINGIPQTLVSTTGNNKSISIPQTTNVANTFTYILIGVKDNDNNTVTVSSSNTVTINVITNYTVSAGNDMLICRGNIINLNATPTGNGSNSVSYSWTGPSGFTSNQQSPSIPDSTTAMSGNYTVTANIGNCKVQDVVNVTVAEPQLTGGQLIGNQFAVCLTDNSTSGDIGFNIGIPSYSSLIATYSIDWDNNGTFDVSYNSSNWSNFILHNFSIGTSTFSVKMDLTSGCSVIKQFSVFVGSSPSPATMALFINQATGCLPHTTEYTFNVPSTNVAGTTYVVSWGDGTPDETYIHPVSIATLTHKYEVPSCGNNVILNNVTYYNVFQPTVVTQNPCSNPQPSGSGLISVSKGPDASFTPSNNDTSPIKGCTNQALQLNNTSDFGLTIPVANGATCSNNSPFYWTITPSTPGLWTATGLGSNNGQTNQLLWTSGSMTPSIQFNQAGNYSITLNIKNSCGESSVSQTFCIEPPPSPAFTLDNNLGCTPLAVSATNNTITTNCSPTTYEWSVVFVPSTCGTTIPAIPNQTTTNASYNFTEAGTYTIRLTATNSCGSFSNTQTVTVKKPPTITLINGIAANYCGPTTLNPTATVINCGSTALTYAWSFPGGTPSSSNLAIPGAISYTSAGNYTVSLIVTNECGSSTTATKSFTINDTPVLTNTSLTQTICSGSSTALVPLTSSPAGATFSWIATATAGISGFTPAGNSTIPVQTISTSNTSSGTVTYAIRPSLGGCLGAITNYVITVNPAPNITTQPASSTICLGGTPTVLSFIVSGATGTPTYQWYSNVANNTTSGTAIPGETNATYTPPSTTAGILYYYCIITLPTGGCSNIKTNTARVTILPNATITAQPTPSQNLCVGVTIPTALTISYSGGTGTASYQWYSNTSNAIIGGIPISGATSASYTPPTYTLAGNYYYYATVSLSGNGCLPATSTVAEVIVFADPTISSQPIVSQTLCQNATPLNLDVTATGGNGTFSYQWYSSLTNSNAVGTLIAGATTNSYTPPTNVVGTKYYYCVVSQSTVGCSVTSATAAIIVISAPTNTTPLVSSTVCLGGTPTPLSVTVSGATGTPTYQWYSNTINNTTTGTAIPGALNSTYVPPATTTGTYYYYCIISLPSGGCASITSNIATVIINDGATINTQPVATQSLCVGATIATPLTVSYTGGTGTVSYQWYSNVANSNSGGTPISGATNITYTPAVFTTTGNYYYYVTLSFSGNGCGPITSSPAAILIVSDPIISVQPLLSQTLCQGATPTILSVTATGGIGTYLYQWYSNSINSNTGGSLILGATNDTFTPPTALVGKLYYFCVITQATGTGCNVTSATAEVIANLAPSIVTQPQSSSICLGKTPTQLSVTYTNGVGIPQYQWYSNSTNTTVGSTPISGATNATYSPPNTTTGTVFYYCVITLPPTGGCSSLTSNIAEVTINPNPVISSKTAIICSGNSFTISPVNSGSEIVPVGTTYTWTTPAISPAGTINGASAQNIPQTSISQTLINTTTSPATVTYTVTPVSGVCTGVNFTIVVTVNPAISSNVTTKNSACFGANNGSIQTNITGGIPFGSGAPYIISWTGPNGFTSSAPNIATLAPGNYNLTITDAGGCPINENYAITEPADIIILTDSEKDITCFNDANGEIKITITGGTLNYTYAWTKNGIPFATTEDLSNLSPGIYAVTVSDANNCGPKTASFTITEPPILAANLVSKTDIVCFGQATGAITINVFGGSSPYTYAWTGPNGFTRSSQNLTNVFAGTYTVLVTDNSGCTKNLAVTLTQNPEIKIVATTTPIVCYGDNSASISIVISGGVAPYQILWSNLGSGTFQDNLSAGDYLITVTDALNCVNSLNVNIPEAPIFTINPVVKNISCFGDKNGSINLNIVGGIPPVTLVWDDSAVAGNVRNNLGPGSYTVTITDGKPCTIKRTFIILEPQLLVLSANITQALDCNDANSGAINLLVSGGSAPFTYSWSNGATTEDLANIPAGNYLVTVKDVNGCTQQAQYSINRPPPIVPGVKTQTDFNCETKYVKQTFVAQVTGGVPPYQLVWSSGTVSGANNEMMNTNQNGTVLLNVTDAIGCKANYTFTVDIPVLGSPSFDVSSMANTNYGLYSINDPIQFTNTATGDFISIIWDFGDGITSTELNPVHTFVNPKDYIVTQTVTYPFGCVYVQKITLAVEKGYVLVVPTAFTPNNDSLNDTFRPVTKGLKKVRLDIYDTWGSMIYSETGDVIKGWDGKIKGINSENGNYYCKVSGETFYGTTVNENTPFVLIK